MTNNITVDNKSLFKQSLEVANKGGKPPKYKTSEELIDRIDKYFDYCKENERKITISGLAMFLGFATRQSVYDYADVNNGRHKTNQFAYIIKRVLLFMEQDYETDLRTTGNTANIFALKNFGWKDETSTTIKGDINNPIGLIAMPAKKEAIEWQEDRNKK